MPVVEETYEIPLPPIKQVIETRTVKIPVVRRKKSLTIKSVGYVKPVGRKRGSKGGKRR